ncbi:MAG: hypothetical protein SFU86_15225 [Pirellulaceae bacterium]|nr:hypothetical protein [Pirellulaceae bacterium]
MTAALSLLIVQGVLGALDTLYYHEFQQRIAARSTGALELRLHAARDFFYALLFGSLAWTQWRGWLAWLLVTVLAAEILITLWDFIEEDLRRPLPPGERVMHTLLAIVYGAFLANLLPQVWIWGTLPAGFTPVSYGWLSWLMTAMALGTALSGLRDLAASFPSLNPALRPSARGTTTTA